MRATISPAGTLEVIPETSIEAYALRQWWRNYQDGDERSCLHVRINPEPSADTDHSPSEGDFD
jgi:hypothetical protein